MNNKNICIKTLGSGQKLGAKNQGYSKSQVTVNTT